MKRIAVLTILSLSAISLMSEESTKHAKDEPVCEENACAIPSGEGLADEIADKVDSQRTDEEWQKILTPEQYRVLRQHGTERAFNNEFWDNKAEGTYFCAGCEAKLFTSETKFNSGTGWPSFYDPAVAENVGETVDRGYGMVRTEVHCNRCGGHLGHVFPDGPAPTGQRYCINSASLKFVESKK